jgi:hypothetical protein
MLNSQCSDAISAMQQTNKLLYRGISKFSLPVPDAFHGRSRDNRKPKHSSDSLQTKFDNIMITYGFSVNRTNSIFCSGHPGQANIYGKTWIIFPINGFEILYSPAVQDVLGDSNLTRNLDSLLLQYSVDPAYAQNFVRKYHYTDANFADALNSNCEIMIKGEYYAFKTEIYENLLEKALDIV